MANLAPGFGTEPGPKIKKAPGFGEEQVGAPDQTAVGSTRLATGAIADSDIENYMANNQSKWELLGKAGAGVLSEAVLGTLEGGSYLLDFEQMVDKMKGAEEDYTNWFADAMKEAKAEVSGDYAKVYQTAEAQTGFAPGDATWWAKHTPSTIGTAISLMIPAAGVAGLAGKGAKLLKASAAGTSLAQGLSATIASRYAESTMEANGVYEQAIAKGASPEDAGKAASKAWNTNWLFALQDFMQYSSVLKGFNSLAKGKKGFSVKELATQMASESAEEAGQFITSEEALRTALDPSAEYFGAGFNKRLGDYIRDPEFQSSALLGAVGGGVFTAAGPLAQGISEGTQHMLDFQKRVKDNAQDNLQREVANYTGDTATTEFLNDKGFINQMAFHKERGTLNVLKANYEALEKDPGALPEARNFIKNKIEDLDFVMGEEARLKTSDVPAQLHNRMITTGLEQKQQARMSSMLEKEVEDLYQGAMKEKQLEPNLLEMKKLQTSLKAYEKLAEFQPQFKPQVAELQKQLNEATAMLKVSHPGKAVDEVLVTNKDEQLFKKAFQLASTTEKMKELKKDMASLNTKEGREKALQQEKAKSEIQTANALVKGPTTIEALQKAVTEFKNPQAAAIIQKELARRGAEKASTNKQSVDDKISASLPGAPLPPAPAMPPGQEAPAEVMPQEVPPPTEEYEEYEEVPKELTPEDIDFDPLAGLDPNLLSKFGQAPKAAPVSKEVQEIINRVDSEEKADAPKARKKETAKNVKVRNQQLEKVTIKTWLKEFMGEWVPEGDQMVFYPVLDSNGYPVAQEYWDNSAGPEGTKVPITEVFATDENGVLLINTPLVKEGDTVILKVENDFRYTFTKGFKPKEGEVAQQVINVYRADANGVISDKKPIAQLDSGDNKLLSAERKAINMELRRQVLANGGMHRTTIAAKNIGTPKRSSTKLNSLSVLEFDYYQDKFQKMPFNPILGAVDRNNNVVFPGDTFAKAPKEYQDALHTAQFAIEEMGNVGGGVVIGRTAPDGTIRLEFLKERKLDAQEQEATLKEMANAFVSGDHTKMKQMAHITSKGRGIYNNPAEFFSKETLKAGIMKIGDNQLAVRVKGGWIIFEKSHVKSFLNNKPAFGKRYVVENGVVVKTEATLKPEDYQEAKITLDKWLGSRQRNIEHKRLNVELPYTDPITKSEHNSYYEFLRDKNVLQTSLRGSNTIEYGQDNSFSYGSTSLYLNPIGAAAPTVTVNTETQKVEAVTPAVTAPPAPTAAPSTITAKNALANRFKKYKLADGRIKSTLTEGEIQWFKDNYGEEHLEIVSGLNKFMSDHGVQAYGMYHNALVTLAQYAPEGTAYHEAGHFVMDPKNGLISPILRSKILKEAASIYGKSLTESQLEEKLMEDFEAYKLSDGQVVPRVTKAEGFFAKLLRFIKSLLGYRSTIEKLYEQIDTPNLSLEQRQKLYENRASLIDANDIKYKTLPGFFNKDHEQEAILSFRTEIINAAYEASKKISQVSKMVTDQNQLDVIITGIKQKYVNDLKRVMETSAPSEEDILRKGTYIAMGLATEAGLTIAEEDKPLIGSWEDTQPGEFLEAGFKRKLMDSFAELGYSVKYDTEMEELTEQDEAERIYDIDQSLVNPSGSISERVKLLLHSIPEPILNEKGEVTGTVTTILGVPKPIDFQKVDAMLALRLADAINPYTRLIELAKVDPISKVILDKLEAVKTSDPQVYTETFVKYRRDTIEKKTVLLTEKEEFIPVDQRDQEELKLNITRRKVYGVQYVDANRNSVFRSILSDWQEEGIRKNVITPTEVLTSKITKIQNDFAAIKAADAKSRIPFVQLKAQLKGMLNELGVVLPDGVWKEIDETKPWIRKEIERDRERYQRLRNLVFDTKKASLESLVAGLADGESPYKHELLANLAKSSAVYNTSVKTGAYLNENGDLEYPINTPSFLSEFSNAVSTADGAREYAESKESDDFFKGNAILELLKDPRNAKKIKLTFLSAIRDRDRDPKMFAERTEIDSIISRFSAFVGNVQKGGAASLSGDFFIGTPSDKGKNPMLTLPKKDGEQARSFLFNVLNNTVENELVRIQNIKEAIGVRERYVALSVKAQFNTLTEEERTEFDQIKIVGEQLLPTDVKSLKDGAKFKYIESLNNIPNLTASLSKGEISPADFDAAQKQKEKAINDFIDEQFNNFVDFMVKNDMVKVSNMPKGGRIINNKRIPKGLRDLSTPAKTEAFLREFFFNDTAYRLEMSKLFMGDIASYKNDDDYFKRAYQLVTPGYKGYTEEPVVVTRGVYPEQFKKDLSGVQSLVALGLPQWIADVYQNANDGRGINKTDAQSVVTIDGYRTLAKTLGTWNNDTHEVLYQMAWSKGLTARKAIQLAEQRKENPISAEEAKRLRGIANNTTLQALKPFQYQTLDVKLPSSKRMQVNVQFKDSITPLIPELLARHQGYAELHKYMTANGFDIMSAADTVKVGQHGVVDMTRPAEEWQKQRTDLSNIRFPQLIPDKSKVEVSGTQFHKLIMGDIKDETVYSVAGKEMTGAQLKDQYNELWVQKLIDSSASLQNKLGLDSSFTFSEDPKVLKEQFIRLQLVLQEELASRDMNDNYKDALQLARTQLNTIDFTIPLSFPQLGEKFQGILTNLFKKKIIKQKSPGFAAVNLADYGVGKSDELKYLRNEKNEITEAEIGLSINFVSKIGLTYPEHIDPKTGRVRWDKLNEKQKEALQMIAYRIPTSNKSSMLPVRVALILPSTMNNIVMIPGELTLQMGLDFDVDKTQLLSRVLTKPEEGNAVPDKDNNDNKLFDLYWSILTNKDHLGAMLTPLSTARLEAIKTAYENRGVYNQTGKSPVFTIQADVATESKNREEKAKVGISSRAATAHSVLQIIPKDMINTNLNFSIYYKDTKPQTLGEMTDLDGGLISENLGEVQQAALDAAKTPLLALFNITKGLLSSAETMLMAGYPLQVVTDFFMQPTVQAWVTLYNQEKQNEKKASERFLAKYGEIKKYAVAIERGAARDITAEELNANVSSTIGENPELDAKVFKELMYLIKLGKQTANLTNLLSLDTMNDASSMEKLITIQEQVSQLVSGEGDIALSPRIFNIDESPVRTKRIAAFYKYMIEDALKFTAQLYPILSMPYTLGRNHILESLNMRTTDEKLLKKIDQFIHFYSLAHDNTLTSALAKVHPYQAKDPSLVHPSNVKSFRWSFRPNEGIAEYFAKFTKKAAKDFPAVLDNAFIKSLRIQQVSEKDGSILGVRNTGDDNKTALIDGWRELFNAGNEEIRVLAHDLARYAIYSSGFTYTPNSFADLIPIEFWQTTGLANAWKNVPAIDKQGLLVNFARTKFAQLDNFPTIYLGSGGQSEAIVSTTIKKSKDGAIKEFSVSKEYAERNANRLPAFVIVDELLYEQSPHAENALQYRRVQPAGSRLFLEISVDGRKPSIVPAHKDQGSPNPWALAPTAVQKHNLLSNVPEGRNDFIGNYLPEDKNDPKAVLQQLVAEETDAEVKAGLNVMLRNVDKINTALESVDTPGKLGVFEVQQTPDGVKSIIKINPNANVASALQMRQVLTHELHHAYSVGVLQNPVGDAQVNFNRNVERLQQEAKSRLGSIQGTQNKFEFIAELASNPEFRNKLRKSDLWSRILRAIRKVLGMTDTYDKVLDQYYSILDEAENLQKLTPGEFALEEEKKKGKPEGKKRLDVFEQMISSLEARSKSLKTRRGRLAASALDTALTILKKTAATNKNKAIVRYLILVNEEVADLKKAYLAMRKTPDKINPEILNPMRDQLLSYSLLDTFATQIRANPADFIPPGGDVEQLLKQVSSLRDEIFKLTEDTNELVIRRVAAFVRDTIPEEEFENLVDNLKVADRDINFWARWQRSFVDINDPVIKAVALRFKNNSAEAYRKTQEQLYKGDTATKESVSIAMLESFETPEGVGMKWTKRRVAYTSVGTFKALKDYEGWLVSKGRSADTFRDKFNAVLDQGSFREGSEGVQFISPFSKEGKEILAIKPGSKDYPLKQFYETVVLGYLKSQEQIKLPSQRPGLRVPTIKRTLMEGFLQEKGIKEMAGLVQEQFMDNFIERFDDSEYQAVNQHGEPRTGLALRFTSKQDGQNGRLTPKEVSLDIASSTMMFVHEMNKREGLLKIQDDIELATQALADREVMIHKSIEGRGLTPQLTSETQGVVMANGKFETKKGVESRSYQALKDLQDRELYGIVKKRQGDVALGSKKVSVSKTVDAFLKFTGIRFMLGNVAIPLTNFLVGEATMLKEIIGGNIIDRKDYVAGQKLYMNVAASSLADLGRREKLTHFGKLFTLFNPMEKKRPVEGIGVDTNRMRTLWDQIISTGGSTADYKLAVTAFGAVLNRFKVTNPEGEQVSMYDGVDITADGKITLKKGYKYNGKNGVQYEKGKTTLDNRDINEVLNYTLKTYQTMHGVYNSSDKSAAHADVVGRLVNFMRSWLAPGIAARWDTKHRDVRLSQIDEGHYVSALVSFNNVYGRDGFVKGTLNNLKTLIWMSQTDETMLLLPNELDLSEDEQAEIINLRKANIRKTLFELYAIAGLGLLIFAGFDEDDDDSYAKYMAARIRREMMTFMDPTTAWDVLRSPTVALNTVESAMNLIHTTADSGWNFVTGEDQEIMERGPGKGENKLLYKAKRFWGMNAEYQFEDLDTKTRFIMKGGFK